MMDALSGAIELRQSNASALFKSNFSSFYSVSSNLRESDKKVPSLRIKNRVPTIYSGGRCSSSFLDPKRRNRGFYDYAHTRYYETRCCASVKGAKGSGTVVEKIRKKKLKLLKGLTKDLSVFSDLASDLDSAKAKILSETTEILVGEMQHLRTDEDESKKKKKLEKAKMEGSDDESSSSSSDGECQELPTSSIPNSCDVVSSGSKRRIEVCMGKKCKESGGAGSVLEELDERLKGGDVMVVRCKCLGKCGEGPNVRVVDETRKAESFWSGVAVKDVSTIVSNYRDVGAYLLPAAP